MANQVPVEAVQHQQPTPIPLDTSLYALDDHQLAFFKSQTGIEDEHALRDHILRIQAEAYAIHPYGCIRRFGFIRLDIARFPAYAHVLDLAKEHPDAIFLDIGCGFGTALRKVVADGWPVQNAIGSDLEADFWQLGHKLFKTTPETFPAAFVAGSALDPSFIAPKPAPREPVPAGPAPALQALTTLTPLRGRIAVIHAALLFHLFDAVTQLRLARALAGLLAHTPGAVILGVDRGLPVPGPGAHSTHGRGRWCHSPASWTRMWEEDVFERGTVRVDARLLARGQDGEDVAREEGVPVQFLVWSVTRLPDQPRS